MARSLKRSIGFAAFGAPFVLVVALSACSDDDSGAPGSLVEIKPSSFVTTPTAVEGATPATGGSAVGGEPGEVSEGEQSYEIERGDNLSAIASDFGVTIDQITNFNNWSDGSRHLLVPGETIRIPPGAKFPAGGGGDNGPDDSNAADAASDDPDLCPNGERRGTYTIQAGDIPGTVARRLNVSLEDLNAANANTQGFRNFVVGAEIIVPCGGDADAADDSG